MSNKTGSVFTSTVVFLAARFHTAEFWFRFSHNESDVRVYTSYRVGH